MGRLKQSLEREQASAKRDQAVADKKDAVVSQIIDLLDPLSDAQQRSILSDVTKRMGLVLRAAPDPHERGGPDDR
jgi:hypothetical protein